MGAVALSKTESGDTHIAEPKHADAGGSDTVPSCAPGELVGNYEVLRLIGRGGMGEVYLARHARLDRQVALKILRSTHAGDALLTERFFHEARTVNAINHEHIVEVHDFVEDRTPAGAPRVYLVMELLKGRSLSETIAAGPIRLRRALKILRQVCDALGAAHQVGVIHRDVKPDNIFLTERAGQRDFAKVLDFGVAKLDPKMGATTPNTIEGMVVGTPAYMAPEQASALGTDGRSDVYSVGTILYEIISGNIPFDAPNFLQVAMKVVSEPPPPLPERTPSGELITPALAALTMACLEKNPDLRPRSMAELAAALDQAVAELGPDPAAQETPAFSEPAVPVVARRRRWPLIAGVVAVLVAIAAAVGMVVSRPDAPVARVEAAELPPAPASTPPVEAPAPQPTPPPAEGINRDALLDPYSD